MSPNTTHAAKKGLRANGANGSGRNQRPERQKAAYIASANADVFDTYNNIVRVSDLRYRPVFVFCIPWTVKKAR